MKTGSFVRPSTKKGRWPKDYVRVKDRERGALTIRTDTSTSQPPTQRQRERDRQRARLNQSKDIDRRRATRAIAERERRGRVLGSKPTLDATMARSFAQILAAGVPSVYGLRYLAPEYFATRSKAQLTVWLNEVASSQLVLDAINELNGGEWQALEPERRLEIALDKHLAELAHLLYTNDYQSSDANLQRKMDTAAERLTAYMRDSDDQSDTPWKRFIEDFMKAQLPDLPVALPVITES